MSKLVYIESSPRKDRSHSIAVARAFLDAYRAGHPSDEVDTWDLWAAGERLPEFDGAAITAKYAARGPGFVHTPAEADAWATITRSADRLRAADVLVLAVPMWNYGIPYKLKHLIDVVTQPGLTFRPSPDGPVGLMTRTRAVVVSARGGNYAAGTRFAERDMELPYLVRWLNLIGIADVTPITLEGANLGEAAAAEARAKGIAEAQRVAATF